MDKKSGAGLKEESEVPFSTLGNVISAFLFSLEQGVTIELIGVLHEDPVTHSRLEQ